MSKEPEMYQHHSPLFEEGRVSVVGIVQDGQLLVGVSRASRKCANTKFTRKEGRRRCLERINSGNPTMVLNISNIQGKRRVRRISQIFQNLAAMLAFCTLHDTGLVPAKQELAVEAAL